MSDSDETDLVESLGDPSAYSHAVQTPIRSVQTHISWVFLTGDYAYKLKKPIKLSFLDFSTLAKRKYYCDEELRLNRALSPELYLDVVPIYRTKTGYSLSDREGEPVEYAVKMRQFREEDVLSQAFRDGRVTKAHIIELARKVAAMHAEARNGPELAEFGSIAAIRDTLADHYRVAEEYMGQTQERDRHVRTQAYTSRFMQVHADLFRERTEAGFIRECHGDLHLANICFFEGQIRFFDRIEYSEPFKNIDVMYDLAFLFMDLWFRGRPDWAFLLANIYAETTGDYDGLILLPFYACGRALVRAKVRSILSSEEEAAPAQREKARDEAIAYFDHAAGYAKAEGGRVAIICGMSGSGKSTIASELAQQAPAFHIRSDAVRKHLAGIDLADTSEKLYTAEMTERTYNEMLRVGSRLAAEGMNVILDATFSRRELREHFKETLETAGVQVRVLWCTAPESVLRERVRQRRGDVSDAGEAVLARQLKVFEAPDPAEQALRIDTSGAVDASTLSSQIFEASGTTRRQD
jgi:uncharacterized protein